MHPEETYQSVDGFGFAITYSSAYNLLKMTAADRAVLLRKTFSPTEGYGASYVRISLGCNDFSSTEYSLCDEKGPDDDLLKHFRLYTDETNYVIPVLKELLAINPQLKIIAAPLGGYSEWDRAWKYLIGQDVWLDISSSIKFIGPQEARRMVEAHGADRILFASDYPGTLQKQAIEDVLSLGLSEADNEKIFFRNAIWKIIENRIRSDTARVV